MAAAGLHRRAHLHGAPRGRPRVGGAMGPPAAGRRLLPGLALPAGGVSVARSDRSAARRAPPSGRRPGRLAGNEHGPRPVPRQRGPRGRPPLDRPRGGHRRPPRAGRHRPRRRPRAPGHLRQLPHGGVPRPRRPRLPHVQRVPRAPGRLPPVPHPPAAPERPPARRAGRGRPERRPTSADGEARQAETLDWQLETAIERGVAGTCVFSWTDEWWVGDAAVEGWHFGLTRADRTPRPALDVAARLEPADRPRPRLSTGPASASSCAPTTRSAPSTSA